MDGPYAILKANPGVFSLMKAAAFLIVFASVLGAATQTPAPATFYRDALPVLQNRCQTCHRPGEAAPMPFMTYEQARPWAKAIKTAVLSHKMPPWYADPSIGHFANDPSLTAQELQTLVAWVDAGAPEGNAKNAPAPRQFTEGWNIGKPDVVYRMPQAYKIPSEGIVEYTYVIIPSGFTEDRWIQAAEYRPDKRALTHHAAVFAREPGSKWLRNYPTGEFFIPEEGRRKTDAFSRALSTVAGAGPREPIVLGYAPGNSYKTFPEGEAVLIKAGTDFVLQMHYTPNGTATTDLSSFGFTFSKTPPSKRLASISAGNVLFVIPPGNPDYTAKASFTVRADCELLALAPHMHLRGKSMEYTLVTPDGVSTKLLSVPKYDFRWQLSYELDHPIQLVKGSRIDVVAKFDNSANNPFNPDPKAEVRWGDQTTEEMMVGFAGIRIPADMDPLRVYFSERPSSSRTQ